MRQARIDLAPILAYGLLVGLRPCREARLAALRLFVVALDADEAELDSLDLGLPAGVDPKVGHHGLAPADLTW